MINEKLETLYKSKWENLSKALLEINQNKENILKASNPLLIKINENDYYNSKIKVMIFGQETNSWYGDFNSDMGYGLKIYEEFYNSNYCYKYGGQFWNGIKRLKEKLEEIYSKDRVYLIWNNICKIGNSQRNTNKAAEYILEIEEKYFDVVREEIKIIKPDLIIFFTGPYYDNFIEQKFDRIKMKKINGYEINQIVQIAINNNYNNFRTYHPNYLWRKKGRLNEYLEVMIKEMNN